MKAFYPSFLTNAIVSIIFLFFLYNPRLLAQTNYYSNSSYTLDNVLAWGVNSDGSGANPPNFTTAGQIFNIVNNPSPTIGAAWAVSGTGSQVVVGDGTNPYTFTIPSGFLFTSVATTIAANATLVNQYNSETATSLGTCTINGTYQQACDGGAIPTATWNTSSNCNITGVVSTVPTNLSQNFYNFLWNCTGEGSGSLAFNNNFPTGINGTCEFRSDGTGQLNWNFLTGGGTKTWAGDLIISGSHILMLTNATTAAVTFNIRDLYINTNYLSTTFVKTNNTGSSTTNLTWNIRNISISGSSTGGFLDFLGITYDNTTINMTGNLNMAGGKIYVSSAGGSAGTCAVNFAGTTQQNVNISGISAYAGITGGTGHPVSFTANSGSIVNFQTDLACGTGAIDVSFVASNGSTLMIQDAAGITAAVGTYTGSVQTPTTRTFNTGVNYTYNGSVAQITGTGLPATVNNLTLSNSAGVSVGATTVSSTLTVTAPATLTGAVTVNGTLAMSGGTLTLSTLNLTLATAATITGTFSSSNMVVTNSTGQLIKNYPTGATNFTFPIGDASPTYSPVSVNLVANGTAGTIGARVVNGTNANMNTGGTPNDYLTRYFVFSTASIANYAYNLSFAYANGDVQGNSNNLELSNWNGSAWVAYSSTNTSNTMASNGVLSGSALTLNGAQLTGRDGTPSLLYYRSAGVGPADWNTASSWQTDVTPAFANPIAALAPPTSANSVSINIQSGNTITVAGAVTASYLYVDGTLQLNTGGSLSGPVQFDANSFYVHNQNGGTVPTATWNTSSSCTIIGTTTSSPTGISGQTFGAFTWDNTSQSIAATLGLASASTTTFNGNFTLQSTGSGTLSFASGVSATANINGDLVIQSGTLNMNNSGAFITTLNLAGNYNQTGGVFQTGAATSTQALNFSNAGVNKNYIQSSGTVSNTGIAYTVNSGAIVTLNNNMAVSTSFTVTGTLYCGTNVISGTGSFTLTSATTATLGIGSTAGINISGASSGNIQTGSAVYGAAANYIYDGTSTQVTGTGLITANNLTFTCPAISLSAPVTVSAALALNGAMGVVVTLGNYSLTCASLASTSGYSTSNMFVTNGTGQLIELVPATGTYTFPVGDNSPAYSPCSFTYTAGTFSGSTYLAVRVTNSEEPNVSGSNYLNRYWTLLNNITGGVGNGVFNYNAGSPDVVGTEASIYGVSYAVGGGTGSASYGLVNTGTHTVNAGSAALTAGVTYDFTGGANLSSTLWFQSVASGNWNSTSTWQSSSTGITGPWAPATVTPNAYNTVNAAGAILIQNGNQVTVTSNLVVYNVALDNNAGNSSITVNSGVTMTVLTGAGNDINLSTNTNPRLTVNGTLVNYSTINGSTATTTTINGTYIHAQDGGTVPSATWGTNSNCDITGVVSTVPSNLSQNFYNFLWNCTGEGSSSLGFNNNFPTGISGTCEFRSDGTGQLNWNFLTAGGTKTWTGDLIISGAHILMLTNATTAAVTFNIRDLYINTNYLTTTYVKTNNTGSNTTNLTWNMRNLYINGNSTGGFLDFLGITYDNTTVNMTGNLTMNGGKIYVSSAGGSAGTNVVNFSGTTQQNINISGISTYAAIQGGTGHIITFTANSGSIINFQTDFTCGSGAIDVDFVATNGSTLMIGDPNGITSAVGTFTGSIQTPTVRTFNAGVNYTYNGSVAQITGTGLPATLSANLTINNSSGTGVSLSASTALNGSLTLTAGQLILGTGINLTMGGTSTVSGTYSTSCMVALNGTTSSGQLIKTYNASATTDFTFPVGTGSLYGGVRLVIVNGTTARNIGIRVINSVEPNIGTPPNYINAYWDFTDNNFATGSYTYTGYFSYVGATITGSQALLSLNRWNGSSWTQDNGSSAGNNLLTSASGLATPTWTLSNSTTTSTIDFTAFNTTSPGGSFYSNSTGTLDQLSSWGANTDGSGANPTSFTSPMQIFYIRNNPAPTLAANWTVSGSASNVILGDGTNACNFTIPASYSYTGPIDVDNNGTLTIQNTTNPTVGTLYSGSTVNYASSSPQSVLAANYYNLSLSNSNAITLPSGTVAIAGTFTPGSAAITNTGNTITYNGTASQTIAAFNYNNLTVTNTQPITLASSGIIGIAGTYTPGSATYTITGSTMNYNGSASQTVLAINYNNLQISNTTGPVTLPSSGTIGIAGAFTPATSSYTTTGSTVSFNGGTAQSIPAFSFNNLTLSNTSGASLTGAVSVAGTLTMAGGTLSLGNYNLGITNSATSAISIASPSASEMIITNGTGQLVRAIAPSSGTYLYPIGETVNYTPASLNFSANSATRNVGILVAVGQYGQSLPTDYINRYWNTTDDGGANTFTYTPTFTYVAGDVMGSALMFPAVYNSSTWTYDFSGTVKSDAITFVTAQSNNLNNSSFTGRVVNVVAYRSVQTGNWSDVNTWQESINGGAWATPANPPDYTNSTSILIENGNVVTVTANVTVDEVIFDNTPNSTITVNNGVTLTVYNGVGNDINFQSNTNALLIVNGTLLNNGQITMSASGSAQLTVNGTLTNTGTITGATATNTAIYGTYIHQQNGGAIPLATWNTNSNCNITGITNTAPSNFAQNFYNVLWDCPSQNATITSGFGIANFPTGITGLCEFRRTNGEQLNWTLTGTTTWAGDLMISGARILVISGTLSAPVNFTIRDFSLSTTYDPTNSNWFKTNNSGTNYAFNMYTRNFSIAGSSTGGFVDFLNIQYDPANLYISGNFTMNGGKLYSSNNIVNGYAANDFIYFDGTTQQNINISNTSSYAAITTTISQSVIKFVANSGSIVNFQTDFTTGTGSQYVTFTANSGSTLMIPDANGIIATAGTTLGSVQTPATGGSTSFNTGGNYIYTGSVPQVTGSGLPTSVNNFTIDNTSGGTTGVTLSGAETVNGTLTLTSGLVTLGAYNLTLPATAALSGTPSVTSMLVTNGAGKFIRGIGIISSNTSFLFPVGDATPNYTPVTLTFASNTSAGNVGLVTTNSTESNMNTPFAPGSYLSRYWTFSNSGLTNYNYTGSFTYPPANLNGSQSNLRLSQWGGAAWNEYTGSSSASDVLTETTALTQATGALTGDFTGRTQIAAYNVTGGTNCGSTTVGLSNSQTGVSYQLVLNGSTNIGGSVAGTGSALAPPTWSAQTTPGTYTVVGTYNSISVTMAGDAVVIANPNVYNVTGGTNCASSDVGLNSSDNGVNYELVLNGSVNISGKPGTGAALDFGSQTAPGTYTVVATNTTTDCSSSMNGSSVVNANPTVYNVTGGSNCGSSDVGLNGSDNGVNYELVLNGSTNIGSLPGTSAAIDFGTQTAAGTYTVVATNASSECMSDMNSNSIVLALPTQYNVTGGLCVPADLGLSGSETGIDYYLQLNGVNTGQMIPGNGSALAFGYQGSQGVYSISAINTTTGCTDTMTGIYDVSICTATWTGTSSSDWFDPTNWSPEAVPNVCGVTVIIDGSLSNYPVITGSNVNVGGVEISSGASITLDRQTLSVCGNWSGGSGTNATVGGTGTLVLSGGLAQTISGNTEFNILQVANTEGGISFEPNATVSIVTGLQLAQGNLNVSAGTLNLLSTSSVTNSYIDDFSNGFTGTITGNIIADRYVPVAGSNQHFVSSPVDTPSFIQLHAWGPDGSYVVPTPDCDETQSAYGSPYGGVFQYNDGHMGPNQCMLGNWEIRSVGNTQNGKGYSVYLRGDTVLSLTGTANTGDMSISGLNNSGYPSVNTLQGEPIASGWNLVGNPYPSALNVTNTRTGFDNQIQLWQTDGPFSGSWQAAVITENGLQTPDLQYIEIAPFQAFMVQVSGGAGQYTYDFLQSERVRTTDVPFYRSGVANTLVLDLDYNGMKDVTRVAFNASATDEFDGQFDANKRDGSTGRPTLYTYFPNQDKWYSINTIPALTQTTNVPMGLRPENNGTMTITPQYIESFDPTAYIYLEDKTTGTWTNLRNGAYTFTTTTTDSEERFILHFTPPAIILTEDASCEQAGLITIEQPGSASWNYTVTDINNITIATGILNSNSPVTASVAAGGYSITLTDNSGYTVVKTVQVQGSEAIAAAFGVSETTAEVSDKILFTSTTPNASAYNWDFGDGTAASGQQVNHSYQLPGVYTAKLMVTGSGGCISYTSQIITVTSRSVTGINNVAGNNLSIWSYENTVFVDFSKLSEVDAEVQLYNVLGQLLSDERFGKSALYSRGLTNMEAAYIIVKVISNDQVTAKKVFIANVNK